MAFRRTGFSQRGKGGGGSRGPASGKRYVYALGNPRKPTYIGMTSDPARRAKEHKRDGKQGKMTVLNILPNYPSGRRSEASRIYHFRRKNGRNPRYNKTDSGGWPR